MSGIYTAIIPHTSQTASVDLLEVIGHATRPYVLLELHLTQTTELGDSAEEQILVSIKSGSTTSGSGGNSAANGVSTEGGGSASGFTFETQNTTKAQDGTIVTHVAQAWNVRGPFDIVFTELSQLVMPAARRLTVEIAAPADATTIGGYAVIQEIG